MRYKLLKLLVLSTGFVSFAALGCPDTIAGESDGSPRPVDSIKNGIPERWQQITDAADFNFKEKEAERRALYDAIHLIESTGGASDIGPRSEDVDFGDRWKVAARMFALAGPAYKDQVAKWEEMEKIRLRQGDYSKAKYNKLCEAVQAEFNATRPQHFEDAAERYQRLARYTPERWKDAARAWLRMMSNLEIHVSPGEDRRDIYACAKKAGNALSKAELHQDAAEAFVKAKEWKLAHAEFKKAGDKLGMARMLRRLGKEKEAVALFLEVAAEFEKQKKFQEAIWAYREGKDLDKARALEEKMHSYLLRSGEDEIASIAPIGGGKNATFLITFKNGLKAVFKPVPLQGRPTDNRFSLARVTNEMMMWELDSEMKFDRIPITVARGPYKEGDFHLLGAVGSLQVFIHDAIMARDVFFRDLNDYGDLAWFDLLVAYMDRNDDNYFVRSGDHVGIDNEDAFNFNELQDVDDRWSFYEDSHDIVRATVPSREFYDKLKALTPERIKARFSEQQDKAAWLIKVRAAILSLIENEYFAEP